MAPVHGVAPNPGRTADKVVNSHELKLRTGRRRALDLLEIGIVDSWTIRSMRPFLVLILDTFSGTGPGPKFFLVLELEIQM